MALQTLDVRSSTPWGLVSAAWRCRHWASMTPPRIVAAESIGPVSSLPADPLEPLIHLPGVADDAEAVRTALVGVHNPPELVTCRREFGWNEHEKFVLIHSV